MRGLLMRRQLGLAIVAVAVCAGSWPGSARAEDPPESVEVAVEQDPAVYGGTAANACGWPTAVYLSFGFSACSGTLVAPEIVITAAHCPNSTSGTNATVSFGEGFGGGERNVSATCYSSPGWTGQVGGTDFGYCRLSQPVTDVPIIPPAYGCDVSALAPGREVVIVGFGQSDNGGSGSKREVTTTLQAISSQAVIGGGGKDACQGDSGGPVYIKLKSEFGGDDTWRAFGITSGGGQCGQGGVFALMHQAIPWIEDHSGVDITPCHNVEGDWEPTPACGLIPLDPAAGVGDWSSGCSDGPVSGLSALCGDPFGAGDDQEPPTVNIISPTEGTVYMLDEPGGTANVGVAVSADDGEGFGVQDVRLLINGAEFPGNVDPSEPYTWDLVFPAGGYVIEAIATDYTGNESAPVSVAIGVDQEAPAGGGDGGDGGDSGSDGGEDEGGVGETGGIPTTTGFGGGGGSAEIGCACSSGGATPGGGLGLVVLSALALLGLRRRD